MAGNEMDEVFVEKRGFTNDRRFMLVDEKHRFVTARAFPFLIRIAVDLKDGILVFRHCDTNEEIVQPVNPAKGKVDVGIWKSGTTAHFLKEDRISPWISRLAGTNLRLVYMADDDIRPVSRKYGKPGDIVSFADGYPVLVTHTASLDDLNRRLEKKVSIRRFRPNLVVSGGKPWAEDRWKRLKIGDVILRLVKPCARCVVTTIDPDTGIAGSEPLHTLSLFRRSGNKVLFGMNATVEKEGLIKKEDKIELLE